MSWLRPESATGGEGGDVWQVPLSTLNAALRQRRQCAAGQLGLNRLPA